jgi:hypothetical protein
MIVVPWFSNIGLFFDIVGAIFLSYGLIITKKEALELGLSSWASYDDKENLKIPAVKDRMKQSTNAKLGLFFLILGFAFQFLGNWPKK